MTTKEYLSQYKNALEELGSLRRAAEGLRDSAVRITPNYQADGTQHGSGGGDSLGEKVASFVDIEADAVKKIADMKEKCTEIYSTIQKVPDSQCRTLLTDRYINGLPYEVIARNMKYTTHYISHDLHEKAVEMVEKILQSAEVPPKST